MDKFDNIDVVTDDDTDVIESIELGMDIAKGLFDESSGKSLELSRNHIFFYINGYDLGGIVISYHLYI